MATEYCTPSVRIYNGSWSNKGTSTTWYGQAAFGKSTRGLEISFTPTKATTSQFHILVPQCVDSSAGSGNHTWYYRVTNSQKSTAPQSVTGNIASGSATVYSNVNTYANAQFQFSVSGISAGTKYYVYLYSEDFSSTGAIGYAGNSSTSGTIECRNYYTESSSSTTYKATLNYNANGGSGAPSSQTVTGTSAWLTATISSTIPTRSGYTFLGWSSSSTATSATYSAGGSIDLSGSTSGESYTLYAVWKSNSGSGTTTTYYYRCYDLTNGSYITSSTSSTSSSITRPSQSGYTYKGYVTHTSFSNCISYQSSNGYEGTSTTCSDHNSTYPYIVFFYTEDTSSTTTYYYRCYDLTNKTYITSSTSTTNSSITRPTQSGYTYQGYTYYDSFDRCLSYQESSGYDGTGTTCSQHSANNPYVVFFYTKDTTYYYAQISYNANGGSGAPSSHTSSGTSSSVSVTLSSTTPTRSGYTFLGWSTSSTATSASYSAGGTYTFTGSTGTTTTTLYAVWKQITYSVTISYNANNGSGAPSSQTQTGTSSSISVTLSSTKPTRTGYNFLGWATSSSATSATYQPGTAYNFTGSTSGNTVTLYAVWQAVYTATISYNANGGSGAPSSHSGTSTSSTSVSVTLSSTQPTRSGYNFLGWSTSQSATTATYQPGTAYNFTGSISGTTTTLYAVWSQITYKVTVSYNANGGSGAPSSQTLTGTSSSISVTLSATRPTRSGYNFLGWSTSQTATSATYQPSTAYNFTGTTSGATVTLYAVWSQITYSVTISYNANGGSGAPSSQSNTSTTTSVSIKLSSTIPTRANYDFLGWATSDAATIATYQPNTSYTFTGSTSGNTVTLYAVWKKSSNVYYRINNEWKQAYAYIRKNGQWVPIQTKVRNNNQWKG